MQPINLAPRLLTDAGKGDPWVVAGDGEAEILQVYDPPGMGEAGVAHGHPRGPR